MSMIASSRVIVLSATSVSWIARSRRDRIQIEQLELVDLAVLDLLEDLLGDRLVAAEQHLAGVLVDDVLGRHALHAVLADQIGRHRSESTSIPASRMRRTAA